MNSLKDIRTAFVTKIADTINQYNLDNSDNVGITFENAKTFDPVEYFVSCALIPSLSEHNGKRNDDPDMDEGIYQISVYGALMNGQYDIKHQEIIDYIKQSFRSASPLGDIYITNINTNGGRVVESHFVIDISINWFVISG